jgi:choline dehydrogenase-like flavoprotein
MMLLMSTLTLDRDTMAGNAGVSYKQHPPDGEWDAIAIGSGIGGLSCAALLARRAGKRVLVLERHYTAGGFTHVFHRPGYEWDVGVHYIGEMGAGCGMRALFDEITEGRLKWNAMPEVYDRIRIADRSLRFRQRRGALHRAHAGILSARRRGHRPVRGASAWRGAGQPSCSSPRKPCPRRWPA